jgi:hypothetical protein
MHDDQTTNQLFRQTVIALSTLGMIALIAILMAIK